MVVGNCGRCGEPVDQSVASYRLIGGYEDHRASGGANKIRHRERQPNLVLHSHCVDRYERERTGRGEQGTLI